MAVLLGCCEKVPSFGITILLVVRWYGDGAMVLRGCS